MFFCIINENLNWDILIKNLVLTDGMELRMKNFNMGVPEKPVCRGDCLKRGGSKKRRGLVPQCTLSNYDNFIEEDRYLSRKPGYWSV